MNSAETNDHWSGYARSSSNGSFSDITSKWTVPTASSCSSGDTDSSAWVGIDGANSSTVLQTGTESGCQSGSAFYRAWWEYYPNNNEQVISSGCMPTTFSCGTVVAGDNMFAEVKQNTSNWTLTIEDFTQNWTYSTTQTYSGNQSSAEWILERPQIGTDGGGNPIYATLTNYGSIAFLNDTQNGANPGHSYSTDSIDMIVGGTNISTTSNPNSLTDAFSVQYGSTQPSSPTVWVSNSPTDSSTYHSIYSMAATSQTSAWATGYEQSSGTARQPVTFYNNGASWTKYSPPSQGLYTSHWLYSIAATSSGDAWTVGEYAPSNNQTLAYRWNNATKAWSRITSDSPSSSSSNELYGVAIDASDNVYAVGHYFVSGTGYLPLLEEYNGTKLAQQTISLPSGQTRGELFGVAFRSSTNGFAVGDFGSSSSGSYLIYHYDGTSWTPTAGSTTSYNQAILKSVTMVSDTEAWAVGTQGTSGTPLIFHYTTANGWQEDTSFNGNYPNLAHLLSVSGDSASDVWIVGYWYNSSTSKYLPYTMHYNGSSWTQINTPAPSSSAVLQGVAVNSGEAWSGGYNGTVGTGTPTLQAYNSL